MKRIFCLLLLVTSLNTLHAQESNKTEQSVVVSETAGMDSVDALLDDERQNPTQEAPEIKPVSTAEFWLKKIGTAILINCIYVKQYIMHQLSALSGSQDEHEEKDSN
ncbi:MAG: hypothetical protein ACHQVS_01895 [Candidatus Babeliales bacterium]